MSATHVEDATDDSDVDDNNQIRQRRHVTMEVQQPDEEQGRDEQESGPEERVVAAPRKKPPAVKTVAPAKASRNKKMEDPANAPAIDEEDTQPQVQGRRRSMRTS